MSWRISLFSCMLLVLSCKKDHKLEHKAGKEIAQNSTHSYLIEMDEFIVYHNNPNVKIIDFRNPEIYKKEHIQGALNIWRPDIEDNSYPYGGMMAQKQQIETVFSDLGILSSDTLIVYDDNGLCDASRFWWVLQNYDFSQVKLLHGGFTEYKLNGGKVTDEYPVTRKSEFKLSSNPSMKYLVSKEDLLNSLNSNIILLDSRSFDEFSGKRQKSGASRGGRIPNSIQLDWSHNIHYNGDKKLRSISDLQRIYKNIADSNDSIIVYCHSGVRSAHTTFVLTQLLGYTNVKNYDGSWTEWSYYYDLPIEKDSVTTVLK